MTHDFKAALDSWPDPFEDKNGGATVGEFQKYTLAWMAEHALTVHHALRTAETLNEAIRDAQERLNRLQKAVRDLDQDLSHHMSVVYSPAKVLSDAQKKHADTIAECGEEAQ